MTTCLYCGRPIGRLERLRQILTGCMWRVPPEFVPYVCCEWCGRQWVRRRRPMRLEAWESVR